jgi:hypothetical protein
MARDGVAPAALPQNPAPKQYQRRNKGNSMDGDPDASSAAAPLTKLGDALASRIPSFNMDWRKHLVSRHTPSDWLSHLAENPHTYVQYAAQA